MGFFFPSTWCSFVILYMRINAGSFAVPLMHKIVLLPSLWYLSSEWLTQLSYNVSELPSLLSEEWKCFPWPGISLASGSLPGWGTKTGTCWIRRAVWRAMKLYCWPCLCVEGCVSYVAKLHRSLSETCEAAPLQGSAFKIEKRVSVQFLSYLCLRQN